jgi:hypothetical protein
MQRGGRRDRLIACRHIGDYFYSLGTQQRPARCPGDLVIIDDHDPGQPGAGGVVRGTGSHTATIAAGGRRSHQ